MSKTIAIIPARGGSKRLPNKNILPLGGMPLIAHSILYAKANSHCIDEVYVSTDDAKITEIALHYGAKIITRPAALSGDHEPTVSAIKHAVDTIENVENIVLLQPTNPLRPANLLTEAFQIYKQSKCDSLMTVTRNHQKFGKITNQKFVPFNYKLGQRSQDLEPLYFENGLLYITKKSILLQNILFSPEGLPMPVEHPFAHIDIDTQDDLDYAEYIYNKHQNS